MPQFYVKIRWEGSRSSFRRSLFAPLFQILNPPLFVENTVTRIVRELLVQISTVFVRSILARYCIDPVIE